MNLKVYVQPFVASWISGAPVQIGQTCHIFSLPFYGSNQINYFFCDMPPLLKLACGDIFVNEMMVYRFATLFVTLPFMSILGLYIRIIATILKLSSKTGWTKAFSTCSSHIIVVLVFYGSATVTYLKPKSNHHEGIDKLPFIFIQFWPKSLICRTKMWERQWGNFFQNYWHCETFGKYKLFFQVFI